MTQDTPGGKDQPDYDRLVVQVQIILENVPDAVPVPDQWATQGLRYIARDLALLTRTQDVGRVVDVLTSDRIVVGDRPGRPLDPTEIRQESLRPPDDRLPPAPLTRLRLARSPIDGQPAERLEGLFSALDQLLGQGVATPEHLVHLAPPKLTHCPATEPEPVHTPCPPYPGVTTDANAGTGITVHILDSGLMTDAVGTLGYLTGVSGDPDPGYAPGSRIDSYAGHGTFCAGVLRAAAPAASVTVRTTFLERAGVVYELDLVQQVQDALAGGADIVSLSAGTHSRASIPLLGFDLLEPLFRAVPGAVLVAAAGNDAIDDPFWPAAFGWVVSVGALDRSWTARAWFSDFGKWVDVYAPGEDLVNAFGVGTFRSRETPYPNQLRDFDGMARWAGTSFATPMVAGLIAARAGAAGQSAADAARALLAEAAACPMPYVGPVLLPDDGRRPRGGCCRPAGHGCHAHGCGHRH